MEYEPKPARSLRGLSPAFLWRDYSPYQCRVSANRENYNLRARLIHLQNMIKTWINTRRNPFLAPVECKACLFNTCIPNIYVGPDGLCNMCMTYRRNFRPEILADELETFLNTPREEGVSVDAVVAFSGGKDSAVSLFLARKRFGLNLVAVLVDNGFIPDTVIRNARDFCRKMGVELVVRKIAFAPHLKTMINEDFRKGYPCYKCTSMFHSELISYCGEHRINRVILGRNWWRWLEPEVRAVRWTEDEKSGLQIQLLSLPFALRLTEDSVRSTLSNAQWSPVDIHGNSTNCLIPGLVEYRLHQRIGYHPELNLLSREVIAGYLTKEKANEQLAEIGDSDGILEQLVDKKLAELETRESDTSLLP